MGKNIIRNYKYLKWFGAEACSLNRPISRNRVNYIKANYNQAEVRPVIVSFRNGLYYVIDGQHTSIALYELNNKNPNTLIYCDVRTDLSYEDESALYVRLNKNSKPIGLVDEIKGLIEARNPTALLFRETVEDFGYTLFNGNTISAVATAWKIFNGKDGRKRLSMTLDLISDTWPNVRNATQGLMLNCITAFLDVHGEEYSKDVFVKKLSAESPSDMVNGAQQLARVSRITQVYALYLRICETYNNRLRSNKLEDKFDKSARR